ncbi:hypothetical protein EJB05_45383, partial [Eragrostis curvula]
MIVHCPVLECLLLKKTYGFDSISINSSTLVSIGVSFLKKVELIVQDAPKLRRLLQLEQSTELKVSIRGRAKIYCAVSTVTLSSVLTSVSKG